MKTKIAIAAIISILLISASYGLQSDKDEFQIQTENQKTAIEDVITIAIALADFITDDNSCPKQNGSFDENSEIYKAVRPYYIETLPIKDPWGNNYLIYSGKSGNGHYGISECEADDFFVVCPGMDEKKEAWELGFSDSEAGISEVKVLGDFNKDLVCCGGSWIRAPEIVTEDINMKTI